MSKTTKNNGESMDRDPKTGQFVEGHKAGFQKGQSGNPKGRRNALSDIIRKILDADDGKIRQELALKLVDHARIQDGDDFLKALDRILDRTEGKPTQTQINIERDPDEVIEIG